MVRWSMTGALAALVVAAVALAFGAPAMAAPRCATYANGPGGGVTLALPASKDIVAQVSDDIRARPNVRGAAAGQA